MPIAAINPWNGKAIEVLQPLTAGQLDGKLGADAGPGPLATAGSLKSLQHDVRKTVDAGGRPHGPSSSSDRRLHFGFNASGPLSPLSRCAELIVSR
jgi:hypothetical protein